MSTGPPARARPLRAPPPWDENAAGKAAPLLGDLRCLERSCETAVLLVHQVRKGAGKRASPLPSVGLGQHHESLAPCSDG